VYSIYALGDPRDNTLRYVGFSSNVPWRYEYHQWDRWTNETKFEWITELKQVGSYPAMLILETGIVDEKEARRREEHWIQLYTDAGMPLCNRKAGAPSLEQLNLLKKNT